MQASRNITGLYWHIDNNVLTRVEAKNLIRLSEIGWIYLGMSSIIEIEHMNVKDEDKKKLLAERRSLFVVSFAPHILGESLLGKSVLSSQEDEDRIRRVHQTLWPIADIEKDSHSSGRRSMGRSRYRDSQIVANAIRYCASALVTHDQKILEASERIRTAFNGFDVISIEAATLRALASVDRKRRFARLRPSAPSIQNLPDWPPES